MLPLAWQPGDSGGGCGGNCRGGPTQRSRACRPPPPGLCITDLCLHHRPLHKLVFYLRAAAKLTTLTDATGTLALSVSSTSARLTLANTATKATIWNPAFAKAGNGAGSLCLLSDGAVKVMDSRGRWLGLAGTGPRPVARAWHELQ